jgi:hypothetical protein
MPRFANERVARGEAMPGLFVVNDRMSVRQAINELHLITQASEQDEWSGAVVYLPL